MNFKELLEGNSELKKAAIKFVKELKKNPNSYSYQLTRLTEWGFWTESGGEQMISLDNKMLKKVANELSKFIKYAPEHFLVELNDMFDFYEMNESVDSSVVPFKELVEGSTIKIDVSRLQGEYSGSTGFDDFESFIDQMKQYGMKDKDWSYDGKDGIIVIPAKYEKYTKAWHIKKV